MMMELDRCAQVEEAWARRGVFADSMASERLADYAARRELARLWQSAQPPVAYNEGRGSRLRKRNEKENRPVAEAPARFARPQLVESLRPAEKPAGGVATLLAVAAPSKPPAKLSRRAREENPEPATAVK